MGWDMVDEDEVDWRAATMLHRLRPWELGTQSNTKAAGAKMGHSTFTNIYVPVLLYRGRMVSIET